MMLGFWIIFALTVLVVVYTGIVFFTNLWNKDKDKKSATSDKNNLYGIIFVVFVIVALIELFYVR